MEIVLPLSFDIELHCFWQNSKKISKNSQVMKLNIKLLFSHINLNWSMEKLIIRVSGASVYLSTRSDKHFLDEIIGIKNFIFFRYNSMWRGFFQILHDISQNSFNSLCWWVFTTQWKNIESLVIINFSDILSKMSGSEPGVLFALKAYLTLYPYQVLAVSSTAALLIIGFSIRTFEIGLVTT